SIEVRMVEDIKQLGAELQTEAFLERKLLEAREVEPTESGSRNLSGSAAQYSNASEGNTPCWGIGYRRTIGSQHTRLSERCWVIELVYVVWPIPVLPCLENVACCSCSCACWTTQGLRLTTLQGATPDYRPASSKRVRSSACS